MRGIGGYLIPEELAGAMKFLLGKAAKDVITVKIYDEEGFTTHVFEPIECYREMVDNEVRWFVPQAFTLHYTAPWAYTVKKVVMQIDSIRETFPDMEKTVRGSEGMYLTKGGTLQIQFSDPVLLRMT